MPLTDTPIRLARAREWFELQARPRQIQTALPVHLILRSGQPCADLPTGTNLRGATRSIQ